MAFNFASEGSDEKSLYMTHMGNLPAGYAQPELEKDIATVRAYTDVVPEYELVGAKRESAVAAINRIMEYLSTTVRGMYTNIPPVAEDVFARLKRACAHNIELEQARRAIEKKTTFPAAIVEATLPFERGEIAALRSACQRLVQFLDDPRNRRQSDESETIDSEASATSISEPGRATIAELLERQGKIPVQLRQQ